MVLHIKLHVNGAFFSSAPENAANFEDHGFRDSEFDVLQYDPYCIKVLRNL